MADRSRSREADKGVCAHYNPRSMKPIRILIVDDHPIMRVGVAALVATSKEMVVAGQVGTGEEAIEQHALLKPDVTLMDLRLPGISGVETIRRIRAKSPDARFIVLTTYEGDEDIHQAMEAGANGYLVKGLPKEMLVNAVRKVYGGDATCLRRCRRRWQRGRRIRVSARASGRCWAWWRKGNPIKKSRQIWASPRLQ